MATVTVVLTTYQRGHFLQKLFEALSAQIYKDFEVLIVLKPSGDNSKQIIEKFRKKLDCKVLLQKGKGIRDAINLALEQPKAEITAFIDDDAIPPENWLQNIVETYKNHPGIGGVTGDVIPASLKLKPVGPSEILQEEEGRFNFLRRIWSKPIHGLEDYMIYISEAGTRETNFTIAKKGQIVKSFLGMGANMSVLTKATDGFRLSQTWYQGLTWEQYLSWTIWKKGYTILYNPAVKVLHLQHGTTLSRHEASPRVEETRSIEVCLMYYRLRGRERLSAMRRIVWLLFTIALYLKRSNRQSIAWLKGLIKAEIMRFKVYS